MINIQKIIKYCAISIAILLVFNIITTIMQTFISIENIFTEKQNNNITEKYNLNEIKNKIEILKIDIKSSNLTIKEDSNFKIENNNKHIKIKENNNSLIIYEEKHNLINNTNNNLIIYIPSEYNFNEVSIENGFGKIEIDNIKTNKIDLELGAGKVNIENITVLTKTKIDGGTGEIIINNGNITNLDLDMGLGNIKLTTSLIGENKINAGIGKIELNLKENLDNYKIKIIKGIGKNTLNNEKINNDIYYGNGSNILDITGGIGNIEIKS